MIEHTSETLICLLPSRNGIISSFSSTGSLK